MRRSEYLQVHTTRVDAPDEALFPQGDSSHVRQQYTDFVRSTKYRGDARMLSCSDCHASHREAGLPADLKLSRADNGACTGCHAQVEPVREHVTDYTGVEHEVISESELACTTCHMVDTARGGAAIPALLDDDPGSATPLQHYYGDRATHRFVYAGRDAALEQPIAATNRCGFCHSSFLPNP